MARTDYHQVLGVNRDATDIEIKKAYRQMALRFHPDKNPGDKEAEEKFKEAAAAYAVLSDPDKKQQYMSGRDVGMGGINAEDIFAGFNDIFASQFESIFGQTKSNRGSNLRIKVKVNLEEVDRGVEKKLKVTKSVSCEACEGTGSENKQFDKCGTCKGTGKIHRVTATFIGQVRTTLACTACGGDGKIITEKCKTCHGAGVHAGSETIDVNIPPGVLNDSCISIIGKGNAAPRGGVAGDLLVVIEEEVHPQLKRDGNNITYDLPVNFADATLGTSADIPTTDGKAKIKIEPGTQSGQVMRLKGKGLPTLGSHRERGDLLVKVNVWVPQNLSDEEKESLRVLCESPNFSVRQ